MTAPLNWLPLIFLAATILSSGWRVAQLKSAHIEAIAFGGNDLKTLLERSFAVLVATSTLFAAVLAFAPATAIDIGALSFLQRTPLAWLGAAIGCLGTNLVAIAQFGMGASWRIGIRPNERSALVTTGLHRVPRNPIYVGMAAMLAGLFFIAPNAITLVLLATGIMAISVQIRLEEENLRKIHGAAFERYCERTRRWV